MLVIDMPPLVEAPNKCFGSCTSNDSAFKVFMLLLLLLMLMLLLLLLIAVNLLTEVFGATTNYTREHINSRANRDEKVLTEVFGPVVFHLPE